MQATIDYDELEAALRRAGSTWEVAQAHGLLCSRLAAEGQVAGAGWLGQVLEGTDRDNALRQECEVLLDGVFAESYRQLAERQSAFELLLPDDESSAERRTEALAHWCEGFLHGLVSGRRNEAVRKRLAEEPLADLIRDMLQITRAVADEDDSAEANERAYAELVEYVRVAAQVAYEELAELRPPRERTGVDSASLH